LGLALTTLIKNEFFNRVDLEDDHVDRLHHLRIGSPVANWTLFPQTEAIGIKQFNRYQKFGALILLNKKLVLHAAANLGLC
jgi:hypothetical protein